MSRTYLYGGEQKPIDEGRSESRADVTPFWEPTYRLMVVDKGAVQASLWLSQWFAHRLSESLDRHATEEQTTVAWVVAGSAGRGEMHLGSDQDGLLFLEESADDTRWQAYAEAVVHILESEGFPPCNAGLMPTEAACRRTPDQWLQTVLGQNATNRLDALRWFSVLADIHPVWGKVELVEEVRRRLLQTVAQDNAFLHDLTQHYLLHRVPLGPFGQLLTQPYGPHAGGLDLKEALYVPLVNLARLWAAAAQIETTNTLQRISALAQTGFWPQADAQQAASTWSAFMEWRAYQPAEATWFFPKEHSKAERLRLKEALEGIAVLQQRTSRAFR
ncbi:MAG: hypothetical protein IMW91_05550 [Firmicutes bacterium]|nr:hypothetical protein [Bacillota bacterium]